MPYNGFIFIGLIKVKDEPYVIEYNVRMGDPETEVVFPRLNNDMLELLDSMGTPKFNDIKLSITENHAATVILVSGGYPESYEKGKTITGLNDISNELIFHAGTIKKDNTFITNGGRVLAVTSTAKDFKKALKSSYSKIDKINFDRENNLISSYGNTLFSFSNENDSNVILNIKGENSFFNQNKKILEIKGN